MSALDCATGTASAPAFWAALAASPFERSTSEATTRYVVHHRNRYAGGDETSRVGCAIVAVRPQPVVLARRLASSDNYNLANILRCVLRRLAMHCRSMDLPYDQPSPAPWIFEKHVYGLAHCLLDRDGRVIGSHLPLPNGPLMAEAPVMAALLRELVAGGSVEVLKTQAAAILRRVDRGRPREPGDDDE